ncbi:hypothetical protein KY284_026750 [Solanum tuberosum]|nr:hypothetical protein KY284_026750 [Solanum tuberosum]
MCPRNPKSRGIFSKILCECNHGPENTEEFDPRFSMNVPISLRMRSCDSRGATNTTLLPIGKILRCSSLLLCDNNSLYGLPDANDDGFRNRYRELGNQWLVDKLYADRVVFIAIIMDGIEIGGGRLIVDHIVEWLCVGASASTVPLNYGPATMRHLSSQIHEVREMMESIHSGSYGAPISIGVPLPTIAYVVAA